MVIVDEKCMHPPPPPPYVAAGAADPPPFPDHQHRQTPVLSTLPSHILLQVVYMTFPQVPGIESRLERQRKTLYWLSIGLRLVNRAFYIACMHVLRSTYLPAYDSLIRPPYSSDPFPLSAPTAPSVSSSAQESLHTIQRETQVLDLFIALKVREDVWADDSELHLEREESFKDLFDLNQPRSRLEDLVRVYGVREGVVSIAPVSRVSTPTPTTTVFRTNNSSGGASTRAKKPQGPQPLPFSSLSVSFSSRRVGLVLTSTARKRTIVEVARTKDEKLEVAAKRLAKELKVWLAGT